MNMRKNALLLTLIFLAWFTVLVLADLANPATVEPGYLTATYGADQWHAQLTAIATGVP